MSADNYRVCPRCEEQLLLEREKEIQKAKDSYGKVPQEEFIKKSKQLDIPLRIDPTLREDWEVYGEGYNTDIRYSCSCSKCGLKHEFTAEVDLRLASGGKGK